MKSFRSTEFFNRSGTGLICSVMIEDDSDLPEVGETVLINGEEKVLRGVETSRHLTAPPSRNPNVGLVVAGNSISLPDVEGRD